ncbi:MAG TPA: FtsW/RodA/SpoVE family cell cycle protein [Trueperaceae bacterium]|nr:FtsW/RodA/SpoVE family cell cycle protein [Trueperaceae bacterium]
MSDRLLLSIQVTLGMLGIVGVAAAMPGLAGEQALRLAFTLGITFVVGRLQAKHIVKLSPYAFVALLLALLLVLFIGVSPSGSDSKRWLLVGGVSVQPSELMKVAVIAYLATFFYNHNGNWEIWRPMLVIGLTAGLIVVEPDVSTAGFVFILAVAIMIAAGATMGRVLAIMFTAAATAALLAGTVLSQFSYIGERMVGYFDRWGSQSQAADLSYQALRALDAIGRGGVLGVGPGRRVPVPEAETDFVAVSLAHSLGFIGVLTVIVLYGLLAWHGYSIARRVVGPAALLAAGATAYICGQAGLNLLVASGMFPVTGMPLPGISYGLNSQLSVAVAFGFLQLASRQVQRAEAEAPEPRGAAAAAPVQPAARRA